ncbi:MAG: substrate-binding domain-containing protein [Euryarchaeota archaeon]|nr:substrate-binding domain-containing protein [Euryarchaeota archaeon]
MVNTKGIRAFLQDSKAVSPAIATLILIVVAAVAAAAIGVMVQSSQGDAGLMLTEKSAEVEGKISTKGSTTVLPISQLAAVGFMSTNPSYQVSVAAGGSGVGRMLVYTKAVDIGASSDPWPTTEKTQDGIKVPHRKDAIIQEAGPDATVWETKIATGIIVVAANINNGIVAVNVSHVDELDASDNKINVSFATLRTAYGTDGYLTLIGGQPVKVVQRSDPGGSEEVFAAWLYAPTDLTEGYFPTTSGAVGAQGNQGIRDYIQDTNNSLGFVDIGYTKDQVNGKDKVIAATMNGVTASKDTKGLGKAYDTASKAVSTENKGLARDLYYYSYGVPKGAVKQFLDYIVSPAGQAQVKAAGFFSV